MKNAAKIFFLEPMRHTISSIAYFIHHSIFLLLMFCLIRSTISIFVLCPNSSMQLECCWCGAFSFVGIWAIFVGVHSVCLHSNRHSQLDICKQYLPIVWFQLYEYILRMLGHIHHRQMNGSQVLDTMDLRTP